LENSQFDGLRDKVLRLCGEGPFDFSDQTPEIVMHTFGEAQDHRFVFVSFLDQASLD